MNIIEAVSMSFPIRWYLYAKEHQAMSGERGVDLYQKVKRIPNVRLIQPNIHRDPKSWIQNVEGIVTITGTTAYKAVLMGKLH